MASTYSVTIKDCQNSGTNSDAYSASGSGNSRKNNLQTKFFELYPLMPDRSLLVIDKSVLRENPTYTISLEIQANGAYEEIFLHNLN